MLIRPGANQGFGFPFSGPQAQPPVDTGGGGGGYIAKAVHFDGNVILGTESFSTVDSPYMAFSMWVKYNAFPFNNFNPPYLTFWVTDPENSYSEYLADLGLYSGPETGTFLKWSLSHRNPGNELAEWGTSGDGSSVFTPGSWVNIIGSVNVNETFFLKQGIFYINDVPVSVKLNDNYDLFTNLFHGLPFYIGNDTFGAGVAFDAADWWIASGVNLLDGGGLIPEATRRQFISASGKPVNPSGFPAGACLFTGDASNTGFQNNQGSGGPFTLQNGTLTNAATSPSD